MPSVFLRQIFLDISQTIWDYWELKKSLNYTIQSKIWMHLFGFLRNTQKCVDS